MSTPDYSTMGLPEATTVDDTSCLQVADPTVIVNPASGSGGPAGTTYRMTLTNAIKKLLDTLGTTRGSIPHRGASAWSTLAPGTANQVLGVDSTATDLEYKTIAAGTNVTVTHGAGTVTIAASGGGGTALTPTAVKTAGYTAVVGDFVPVDTTSGAVTITLPTAPANASQIAVKHVIQGSTNAVTIAAGGSDVFNKTGGNTSLTLATLNRSVTLQYKATGAIWYVLGADKGSIVSADVAAPGGARSLLYDVSGVITDSANWTIGGTSGELIGAAIAAPTITAGQLWHDSTAKAISGVQCGLPGPFPVTIWRQNGTGTAVANSTTATSLLAGGSTQGSLTFAANSFVPGKRFVIEAFGTYGCTGTPTLSLAWRGGATGTQLITGGLITLAGTITGKQWRLRAVAHCRGPAGASCLFYGDGIFHLCGATNNVQQTAIMAASSTVGTAAVAVTIDGTVQNIFDLVATWSAADAANTMAVLGAAVTIEG